MKWYIILWCVLAFPAVSLAQIRTTPSLTPTTQPIATDSAEIATESATLIATTSAEIQEKIEEIIEKDVTRPEVDEAKTELLALFSKRRVTHMEWHNSVAFIIQYAVSSGVPANTIYLILLLPVLTSIVAFFRHVVGVPVIGMFAPIALSITLVATGIVAGAILLGTILLASFVARILFKRIRIMQVPKVALSMVVVSIFIFATLLASSLGGVLAVRQLSIFPVLVLMLVSEQIIDLQLRQSLTVAVTATFFTLLLGLMGFGILTAQSVRSFILLYPESILLLIPTNILIGRYFGLRLTEYFRFRSLINATR